MSAIKKTTGPQFSDKYKLKKEDGIDNWSIVEVETGAEVAQEEVLKMLNRIQVIEDRLQRYNAAAEKQIRKVEQQLADERISHKQEIERVKSEGRLANACLKG